MSRAIFRRPDGRDGTYGQWLAEVSAKWNTLSMREQHQSRDAAAARLGAGIKAQAEGPALMHLYDEIGFFGVWPADVADALSGIKGDVEVHLNSPGGSVFDGVTIYNTLREHPGNVGMVVDGLAASAASFVAMAASPGLLEVTPNGTVMIHEAWGGCVGPARDMRTEADVLDQQTANIANIYAARGGRTAAEYMALMAAETWVVGQEAVDLGLADRVRRAAVKSGEAPVLPVAASLPWQVTILAAAGSPASHGHPGQECWDPDGDGDCDLTPEADTDHDYWAADGTQLKPVPGKPMANRAVREILNEKYSADDRKQMAEKGHAMPDGSYPIADSEDLDNAIRAVGRGGSDHDAIRKHIIKRAQALGLSSRIPENWNSDGSLKDASNSAGSLPAWIAALPDATKEAAGR